VTGKLHVRRLISNKEYISDMQQDATTQYYNIIG
jgi:hypothetical protein